MGGIGKTTLARKVFDSPHAKQKFDLCGWVTVSQVYDIGKLLLHLLGDIKGLKEGEIESLAVHELGQTLYQYLWGRRYLIVLDDMWSSEALDAIRRFLPDNSNGSRVMVTSRLLHVSNCTTSSNQFEMHLLDENESWRLLCRKVFDEENCPPEFEEIGKRIARNCKGLPLSMVVIGGLLAKSEMMQRDWYEISENISEIVNSADNERCLAILSLSYKHLPVYLKPCFLYMGVFPEDEEIHVPRLIKLWVAEGFIKPIQGKSMEDVAGLYLTDLIERNLIFVSGWRPPGVIRDCKTHDLLRDLCLREATKCRFISYIRKQSPITPDISSHRRIAFHGRLPPEICHALESASLLRSVVMIPPEVHKVGKFFDPECYLKLRYFKLLRVLDVTEEYPLQDLFQLVNYRYICCLNVHESYTFSSQNLFWNIQTLVMGYKGKSHKFIVPSILWEMPELRHVEIRYFGMPDPPSQTNGQNNVVQKNLQTLLRVMDFKLTEEILIGRPNIKKLEIWQGWDSTGLSFSDYSLSNLVLLHNLESLFCVLWNQPSRMEVLTNIKFPLSLKRLVLSGWPFEWGDIATTIGYLPQLEILKLYDGCYGEEWNPLDGQFVSLKVLKIRNRVRVN